MLEELKVRLQRRVLDCFFVPFLVVRVSEKDVVFYCVIHDPRYLTGISDSPINCYFGVIQFVHFAQKRFH